ncbi:hypothetical protein PROFUN_14629 [Planoprotostelium fungivorum]|uniref:Major facilitator superfamily (MFS) profile domain-containing protein n=1 Tax=Planoprotostelium fungivorum TaxID=1890364 RepID=A0A2P6N922_9EUKA|nr:hypothetical protein PROFUN_14629 [Planoprotostelium fungivorum]
MSASTITAVDDESEPQKQVKRVSFRTTIEEIVHDDLGEYSPIVQDERYKDRMNYSATSSTEDVIPIIGKLYKRRWWVLLIFGLSGMMQNVIWLTYGPLVGPTKERYSASRDTINDLSALSSLLYIPVIPISTWLLDRIGLRNTMIVFLIIQTLGSGLRMFATGPGTFLWVFVGCALNAFCGVVWTQGITRLSNLWFGTNERTFSTYLTSCIVNLGVAVGFLESLFVHTGDQLGYLVAAQTGFHIILLLLMVATVPARPPTPPTASSSLAISHEDMHDAPIDKKVSIWRDTVNACKIPSYLLLVLIVGVTQGFSTGWSAALGPSLEPLGYSQTTIAWLGSAATLLGIFAGIWVPFVKKIKLALVILFFVSACGFSWLQLQVLEYIYSRFWTLFLACVIANLTLNTTNPLAFELAAEITFPVSEAVTTVILTLPANIIAVLFLVFDDKIGTALMNWIFIGTLCVSTILTPLIVEDYRRLKLDRTTGAGNADIQ